MKGGELLTRSMIFEGSGMWINFSSSAAGEIKVELQDYQGRPIPGFTLDDCFPVFGDSIERQVLWKNGSDLSFLNEKSIRLRVLLKDSDLFSVQFK